MDPNLHSLDGETLGVKYALREGLIDFHLSWSMSADVVLSFKTRIKELARKETTFSLDFIRIHRMARMCWELELYNKITSVDKADAELLYDLPQDEKFEWVFTILNGLRHQLRTTTSSITVADQIAKNLENIMDS